MKNMKKAFKEAFPVTLPILTGFGFLGIAYGFLMRSSGYGVFWTILFCLLVFSGSSQYAAISFLTGAFNPINALIMSFMLNARHAFYGIAFLEKYKDAGKKKPLLIYGLCDETFSLIHGLKCPENLNKTDFMLAITILNYSYWMIFSILGSLLGTVIKVHTQGMEFILVALFVCMFVNKWKHGKDRRPLVFGSLISIVALVLVGPNNFIIPAMIGIIFALLGLEKKWRTYKYETNR